MAEFNSDANSGVRPIVPFFPKFVITFLMLDGLTPKTLGIKSIISKYIDHQKEVIIRRTCNIESA